LTSNVKCDEDSVLDKKVNFSKQINFKKSNAILL
jgi:hypothetical protein